MKPLFKNRQDAGKKLSKLLKQYHNQSGVLLLAIAKGGIDTAFPIASDLNLPLDIIMVRKLRTEGEHYSILGAVATGGHIILNQHEIDRQKIDLNSMNNLIENGRQSLQQAELALRGKQVDYNCKDHTVIVIDDGIRTATTMALALQIIKQQQPKKLIAASPIALTSTLDELKAADELVILKTVDNLDRVASAYEDYSAVTLEHAIEQLAKAQELKFHDFNLPKY